MGGYAPQGLYLPFSAVWHAEGTPAARKNRSEMPPELGIIPISTWRKQTWGSPVGGTA